MKKIFFIWLFCMSILNADVFTNADEAFTHAEKHNRLLVVFAVSDTCRHCHTYINNLKESGAMNMLSQKYDVAILEIKQNLELFTELLPLSVTPTTFILNPKRPDYYVPEAKGNIDSNTLLDYIERVEKYFQTL